jgi:hypothetical protein
LKKEISMRIKIFSLSNFAGNLREEKAANEARRKILRHISYNRATSHGLPDDSSDAG